MILAKYYQHIGSKYLLGLNNIKKSNYLVSYRKSPTSKELRKEIISAYNPQDAALRIKYGATITMNQMVVKEVQKYVPSDIKSKGDNARLALEKLKFLLKTNAITYENAEFFAQEPLKVLNEEMAKISKEHNKIHHKVTFIGFMR